MLNIERLLTEQRYLALDEISTVFLAIGIAQYTIYHFKYRKYKNSAIAKVIDYVEKYYDKEDYYVYMPIVQFTNNQNKKIQSILNIELDDQEYPFIGTDLCFRQLICFFLSLSRLKKAFFVDFQVKGKLFLLHNRRNN